MDYKTKVRLMEEGLTSIKSGIKLEDVKTQLIDEGYSDADIFKVAFSIKSKSEVRMLTKLKPILLKVKRI